MRSTLNHQPWLKVICLRVNICSLLGLPGMHKSNPCPITSSKVGVNARGGMMTTNRYPYHCPINRRPNDIPHGAHTASYSSLGYYGWILKHIGILRPMTMETRCCNFSYQTIQKLIGWGYACIATVGKKFFFFWGCTCRNPAFTWEIVNTPIKNSSRDDRPSISTQNQPTANQFGVCGAWPTNIDGSFQYEGDLWSRRWDVSRGVFRSPPKPEKGSLFFRRRGTESCCRLFLHTGGQMVLCQTPAGARRVPPAVLCTLWPEGGSEPPTSVPR